MFINEVTIALEIPWQIVLPLATLCLRDLFKGVRTPALPKGVCAAATPAPAPTLAAPAPATMAPATADGTPSVAAGRCGEARKGNDKNRSKKNKKKK